MPIKKKTPINESNLSNNPPCPGMMEPESLIDDVLFIIEAMTSPRKENKIIMLINNKYFNE